MHEQGNNFSTQTNPISLSDQVALKLSIEIHVTFKQMHQHEELGFAKSEQLLRKAIDMGLRTSQDNAVARMHLAGICVQTGRRKEAQTLLAEAKKMDTSGMMKEQINQMQSQLRAAPSKNQMRISNNI